ncbi:MAG: BlaI/MecI/CopY family transcriptional regulator [Limisphaerales bacterium]
MPKTSNQPSNLELQVLSVLWERGSATVREVLAALPDGKERAYTTVLTIMQNMEKKGFLSRSQKGNAHVYEPKESQSQTLGPMMQNLLRNVFGGKVSSVMQHLLEDADVSESELKEIRQMIDQRKKAQANK